MRRGSVAIVPLLFALMLFFWFMWFLGGENDSLHEINNVENLQHIQEELIISATQQYIVLQQNGMSEAEAKASVNTYVTHMMKLNKIQE
ncbi:hypothetical protein [Sulfuricurvum sp.]|uniref:hypothetical protein n=1 Tax=Sulfuricurvum sp. TaxID=2025608 RepID=UPI003C44C188